MLIKGADLSEKQRRWVLGAFVYRNTHENRARAEPLLNTCRLWISDAEWIADHAFHFVADGSRLDLRYKHAEPMCLVG